MPGNRFRAHDQRGRHYPDPTIDGLFHAIRELGDGNEYLIVERVDAPDGDHYAQTRRRPDGTYIVEYRAGSATQHYRTVVTGPRTAHAIVAGWLLGLPGWRDQAGWVPLVQ